MKKKKSIILSLCLLSIGSASVFAIENYRVNADGIKILEYKSPKEINENGYQINKYEGENAVAWLNENEVLITTRKSKTVNEFAEKYLSIYNVNTKEARDFKDVDMKRFYGVSKTGKYVLYGEYREVSSDTESEEFKAYDEGTIQREPLKILNLESGEITEFNTQNKNVDAHYSWISDNKILMICNNETDMWQILNINGEVCSEGKFDFNGCNDSGVLLAGGQDLKDLEDKVEGKFYYTKCFKEPGFGLHYKVFSMDVNTKKEELIEGTDGFLEAQKRGNSILMDYYNYGKEENSSTYGFRVFSENGSIIQSNESPLGIYPENYKLSNDGDRVCYLESNHESSRFPNEIIESTVLKVMDVKSGNVKEIAKLINLIESDLEDDEWAVIADLEWDKSGTSLLFNIEYSRRKMLTLTLDEEGKKAYRTESDTVEIPIVEKVKNDTYIITFDR